MRKTININKGWKFVKENVSLDDALVKKGVKVNLPHTWNNLDGQDGGNDYVRDAFWYVKELNIPKEADGNEVYVEFLAVSQIADVYMNGEKVAHHEGGFSTFRVNITKYIKKDSANILAVRADNSPNEITYPQFADFTFFGGIYRDVNLIIVPHSHIDLDYFGSDGVMVTPKVNEDGTADVKVQTFITNPEVGQTLSVHIEDYGVAESVIDETQPVEETTFELLMQRPILWQGRKNPHLYTCTVTLLNGETVLDRKMVNFGVRSYHIDPNEGFFLNGEKTPLRGVCRHQDRLNMGWAITNKEHEEDCALIAEMGANTIRLAHYQQAQYMYDLCDMYGFAVWVEIPFISRFMPTAEENTLSQMKELIIQSYNHPSIICWGLSNEITMNGDDEQPELLSNHYKLNELCHELDPTRLTTMAQVSMLPIESKMNEISDIFSYNIYYGWYVGEVKDNAVFLDECHAAHPTRCMGISEYGCEAILTWHSDKPECGDYTEEYQAIYHEGLIKTIRERDYLWATHVWNMFDFAVDMRDEGGCKGRNNKGLVTFDRKTRKDSFYAYKAWLNKEDKFVHLCGKRYANRHEDVTKIKVYSNLPEVTLKVNGKTLETKTGDMFFEFDVKLKSGLNVITAVSGVYKDKMTIKKVKEPDKSYILGHKKPVVNWFDKDGNELKLEFPDGYYSINDKIRDIMKNEQGKALLTKVLGQMAASMQNDERAKGMNTNPDAMIKMIGQFSIMRIASMMGDKVPKEALVQLNMALNQIKKDK